MLGTMNIEDKIRLTSFGVWIRKDDTHIGEWIEQTRRLDHHTGFLDDLLPFIPEGGVVVDVGAYIGDHTISYINKVGDAGTVYAFEPNVASFLCLIRNCPTAKAFMVGLGDEPGFRSYVEVEGNFAASHLARNAVHGTPVPILTLDNLGIDRLHFVKIDVEGHEWPTLAGMRQTILRTKPVLCIEMTDAYQRCRGSSTMGLLQEIKDMGYVIRKFTDHGWDDEQYDVLAIPTEAVGDLDMQRMSTRDIADLVNAFRRHR